MTVHKAIYFCNSNSLPNAIMAIIAVNMSNKT